MPNSGRGAELLELLTNRYVLICCEGGCEKVIVSLLVDGDKLVVPRENIVFDPDRGTPYTGARKADDIVRLFLKGRDYTLNGIDELLLARVFDSGRDGLRFPKLYRDRVIVRDFLTRPEIEMLVIAKENAYESWKAETRLNRQLRPSEFCKIKLDIGYEKTLRWHKAYWRDADEVEKSIREYERKRGNRRRADEYGLVDLLR